MTQVRCPTCEGTGAGGRVHVNTGYNPRLGRHDGYWKQESNCFRCDGSGSIPSEMILWIEKGQAFRKARQKRYESLMDCAARLGIEVTQLSAIESGRVKPPEDF